MGLDDDCGECSWPTGDDDIFGSCSVSSLRDLVAIVFSVSAHHFTWEEKIIFWIFDDVDGCVGVWVWMFDCSDDCVGVCQKEIAIIPIIRTKELMRM